VPLRQLFVFSNQLMCAVSLEEIEATYADMTELGEERK
jgi:hypothetical protein